MRKILLLVLILACVGTFFSCNTATPNEIFSIAVLNANMLHGFAGEGMNRQLESPGVKLVKGSNTQTEDLPRMELIETKIQFLEDAMVKIKKLPRDGDAKDIVHASIALYEFALPVYKSEYLQLAQLYDSGAGAEQTVAFANSLNDKYYPRFEALHQNLTTAGKDYASRHKIDVQWDVSTSPRN